LLQLLALPLGHKADAQQVLEKLRAVPFPFRPYFSFEIGKRLRERVGRDEAALLEKFENLIAGHVRHSVDRGPESGGGDGRCRSGSAAASAKTSSTVR